MLILVLVAKVACHLLSSYCGEASVLQVQDFDKNHRHLPAVLSKPHPRPFLFRGLLHGQHEVRRPVEFGGVLSGMR